MQPKTATPTSNKDMGVLQSRDRLNSENGAGTWHVDTWAMIQQGSEENEQISQSLRSLSAHVDRSALYTW